MSERTLEQRVDDLLVGAIDPHVHTGPSIAARATLNISRAET